MRFLGQCETEVGVDFYFLCDFISFKKWTTTHIVGLRESLEMQQEQSCNVKLARAFQKITMSIHKNLIQSRFVIDMRWSHLSNTCVWYVLSYMMDNIDQNPFPYQIGETDVEKTFLVEKLYWLLLQKRKQNRSLPIPLLYFLERMLTDHESS